MIWLALICMFCSGVLVGWWVGSGPEFPVAHIPGWYDGDEFAL